MENGHFKAGGQGRGRGRPRVSSPSRMASHPVVAGDNLAHQIQIAPGRTNNVPTLPNDQIGEGRQVRALGSGRGRGQGPGRVASPLLPVVAGNNGAQQIALVPTNTVPNDQIVEVGQVRTPGRGRGRGQGTGRVASPLLPVIAGDNLAHQITPVLKNTVRGRGKASKIVIPSMTNSPEEGMRSSNVLRPSALAQTGDNLTNRKTAIVAVLPNKGKGRGRGRGRSIISPRPVSLSIEEPRLIYVNPISPSVSASVVKEPRSQKSSVTSQLETWDKAITKRPLKTWLSDPEFVAAAKMANLKRKTCHHVVIPTTCRCSQDRALAVCTRCYLVFCNWQCLQKGLETPNSRIGLAFEKVLKVTL